MGLAEMMRVDVTPLPGAGVTGVGSVRATPRGCVPDHAPLSSTAEVKPSRDVTIHALVALLPCKTVNDDGSHSMRKSDFSESLATLLVEDSSIHASPDASTTKLLGRAPEGSAHSVKCSTIDLGGVLDVGVTMTVEGSIGPATWVKIDFNTKSGRLLVGCEFVMVPPLDGSSLAILSAPSSTTQGFCVTGLMLMGWASAPEVGTCHSV